MPNPMPSPNGSNLEKLYISRSPFVGARDAAPDMPEDVMRTLLSKFSDTDKAMLRSLLDEDDGGSAGPSANDAARRFGPTAEERRRNGAMLDRFADRVGSRTLTPEQRASYEAMFPNCNRLKTA